MYEQLAIKYYSGDGRLNKALAAGRAMDNALKLDYSEGGTTKCHFMLDNFLKYFDYEKLPNQPARPLKNQTKRVNKK